MTVRGSVVGLEAVVARASIGLLSWVLVGCGAEAPESSHLEDQLSRIEARLDRIDERLQSLERRPRAAQALPVDLHAVSREPALSRIEVAVTEGNLAVNGEPVASIALRTRMEELAGTSPGASVIVQADAAVEHGQVVTVMDTIKKAGFTRIAVAVQSTDAD